MCLIEARPAVQFMFILRYLCGAALIIQAHHMSLIRILIGAVVCECAVFSVYLFNGAMDLVEDRANGSRRPIAAGKLSPQTAQRVAAASAVAAVASGFALGRLTGLLTTVFLFIGYLYSGPPCYLKRNSVSSGMCGILGGLACYASGAAAVGGTLPVTGPELFAVALSLWIGLVGLATKDLSDVAGDAAAGRRTVAIAWGEVRARSAASAAALAVGTGFLVTAVLAVNTLLWPAATVECGALAIVAVNLPRFSAGSRTRRRRPYRAFMMTQYVAHLSLLATLLA
jgi:4-hydroxybenzoate polyprenyltransferase